MQLVTERPNTAHPRLVLGGRFDAFETEAFREAVDRLLAGDANTLTIDMAQVIFVDSSGLAEMVRTMKHCREAGGEMFIESPSDPVRVILELTGLVAAFEIIDVDV